MMFLTFSIYYFFSQIIHQHFPVRVAVVKYDGEIRMRINNRVTRSVMTEETVIQIEKFSI